VILKSLLSRIMLHKSKISYTYVIRDITEHLRLPW